jgi:tRNA pseudouridine32 synthase / 23S rRNA pseudouridine746 synthase
LLYADGMTSPPSLDLLPRLLHRDGLMLVIDKPAGIAVHRGPKASQGEPNLEQSFDQLRFGLPRAPSLAHRLDRDTSGCLVLGRHRKALDLLGRLFKQGKVRKTYWAVVEAGPEGAEGLIDRPLGRLDPKRGWWMKVDEEGQASQTRWMVLGRGLDPVGGGPIAWMALEPLTGRTHQLRVHCQAEGWPILGDVVYGTASRGQGPGLHLHARRVEVPLSSSKPAVIVTAPAPEHMRARLAACGWAGEGAGPA